MCFLTYLYTQPVGPPSGTLGTQCTVALQIQDDSNTGLWTAGEDQHACNQCFFSNSSMLFRCFYSSSPCCSDPPEHFAGHSYRADSLLHDHSSSGQGHIGHNCRPSQTPCKDRLQFDGHRDTVHHCRRTPKCQQTHRRNLGKRMLVMDRQGEDLRTYYMYSQAYKQYEVK